MTTHSVFINLFNQCKYVIKIVINNNNNNKNNKSLRAEMCKNCREKSNKKYYGGRDLNLYTPMLDDVNCE